MTTDKRLKILFVRNANARLEDLRAIVDDMDEVCLDDQERVVYPDMLLDLLDWVEDFKSHMISDHPLF